MKRPPNGFTLVEILVVIAIIAVLAALILPAIMKTKEKEKIRRAQRQMSEIVTAIMDYESTYPNRFPVSNDAIDTANKQDPKGDFTFGTGNGTANATFSLKNGGGYTYEANNAEVIAVLMDMESYANGTATINKDHVKNPQRRASLHTAEMSGDDRSPGVGIDGVYRDPWGNPYVITIDLNFDAYAQDAFYRDPNVSEKNGKPIAGLTKKALSNNQPAYEGNSPVMVWSAGPDKKIKPGIAANEAENADNVLSWK